MPKIVPIVEGEGEKRAVPALCYKILHELGRHDIFVAPPLVAKGVGNLLAAGGLEKFLNAAYREQDCAAVLILLDADDACALTLARNLGSRIQSQGLRHPVVVVIAACEYEAWFLASATALQGQDVGGRYTLPSHFSYAGNVEERRGVKEWLDKQLPAGIDYSPATDQVHLTRLIAPTLARANSRSFRRLCHAIEQILDAVDNNKIVVTPEAV